MRNIFLTVCLLSTQLLFATKPIFIPIGSDCTPTFRLTEAKLRTVAYPFDWITCSFDTLFSGFNNDFKKFFTDLSLTPDKTATVDSYGFVYHHIWHTKETKIAYSAPIDTMDWQAMVPNLSAMYQRRFARVHKACNSDQPVVFVRYNDITKQSAVRLRNLIKKKYPNLTFILVVVKPCDQFKKMWNEPHIRNYSLIDSDSANWKKIFQQVTAELESGNPH